MKKEFSSFYNNVKTYNVDIQRIFEIKEVKDMTELLNVKEDEVMTIIDDMMLNSSMFFCVKLGECGKDFQEPNYGIIDNAPYYRDVLDKNSGTITTRYYDVYLCKNEFLDLKLNEIIKIILINRYPFIFKNVLFLKPTKINLDQLFGKIKLNCNLNNFTNYLFSMQPTISDNYSKISVKDLFNYINDGIKEVVHYKSDIKFYGNNDYFFIKCEHEQSVIVPIQAILNRDITLIKDKVVYDYYNKSKDGIYNRKQSEIFDFNTPKLKKLCDLINGDFNSVDLYVDANFNNTML